MSVIGIEIPQLHEDQEIEVEVKVNGLKKQYHYRVEFFYWDQCPDPEDRAACIKSFVEGYDDNWQLAHIGLPSDIHIPITFKQKRR